MICIAHTPRLAPAVAAFRETFVVKSLYYESAAEAGPFLPAIPIAETEAPKPQGQRPIDGKILPLGSMCTRESTSASA